MIRKNLENKIRLYARRLVGEVEEIGQTHPEYDSFETAEVLVRRMTTFPRIFETLYYSTLRSLSGVGIVKFAKMLKD